MSAGARLEEGRARRTSAPTIMVVSVMPGRSAAAMLCVLPPIFKLTFIETLPQYCGSPRSFLQIVGRPLGPRKNEAGMR